MEYDSATQTASNGPKNLFVLVITQGSYQDAVVDLIDICLEILRMLLIQAGTNLSQSRR